MNKTISSGRVAYLRLKAVNPVCVKAVNLFSQQIQNFRQIPVEVIERYEGSIHAWLDEDLLMDALSTFLNDLASCPSVKQKITVRIKQIGSNICRIVISDENEINLNHYNGPFNIADCAFCNPELNDAQMIIAMHGGVSQVWKSVDVSKCFFEINLVCMSRNVDGEYDSFKEI